MVNRLVSSYMLNQYFMSDAINRFSQDMSLVDMELPMAFANTIISTHVLSCALQNHAHLKSRLYELRRTDNHRLRVL